MNFSNLAYNLITGQWRVDRLRTQAFVEHEKRAQMYAGANPGIKRPTPNSLSSPEDFKQAYERIVLIRGARQMEEDFQFFDGILSDFETYVVGDLRYMPSTGNPDADKAIANYLEWQFDQCDYSQRLDLTKLARLFVRSQKRDGECGGLYVDVGDSIKLSAISGDRIGNPTIATGIGPNDFNGIIIDQNSGAPVQYNIFRRLPKINAYVFQQAASANDFVHYYDPFRFEQYHGVTVFKNSIEHAFDMKQIIDFTKLNIKWRASQLPSVKNEQGRPRGTGYETIAPNMSGEARPMQVDVDGVTQTYLKLDEAVMEYPNDFPNTQFVALMEELKRDCAVGCKLPLEFCYRSQTGGVVQRFYANKAERTFDEDKRWLKRVLLNPLKNRMINKGIQTKELDLKKYGLDNNLARFSGTWQMGRTVSVDYSKEVDADIKLVDAGLMAPQDYASETGTSLEETRVKIRQHTLAIFQDAEIISKETGQDFAMVLPYLSKKFPNPGAGLKAAVADTTNEKPYDQNAA